MCGEANPKKQRGDPRGVLLRMRFLELVEDSYDLLTTRDREALQLFAEGRNAKDVASNS
jgi:hypothetical protein